MKVISNKLPSRRVKCVATVGVFDGVHLGHQFILKKVSVAAQAKDLASLLITFDILPQQFLNKKKLLHHRRPEKAFIGSLTNSIEKVNLINSLNIDYLWFLKTKKALLKLSAKDFINYIQKYFDIEKLIVGEDFRFGHKGRGDLNDLKKLASQHRFDLSIIKKTTKNKRVVSSSLIRQLIQKGDLGQVKQLLGRYFSLEGRVVKGRGVGKSLGFPTANIFSGDYVIPASGVYAAYVVLGKKKYLAAINIGLRPTVSRSKRPVVEAHILNLKKNVLNKTIKIIFFEKIREEKKFASLEVLSAAISKDIKHLTSKYSAFLV